jgi:hypothetical protein
VLELANRATPAYIVPSLTVASQRMPRPSDYSKKRKSSTLDPNGRKRSKQNWRLVVHHTRQFLPLHAALQSGASYHVVQHVLSTYGGVHLQDELGRYPLHVALTRCTADEDPRLFDLVNNHLVSNEAACARESQTNRLPLHIGLDSNAHVSVIERLLDECPRSGIEPCGTNDKWEDELPICRAVGCDLSVVYRMLRVDPNAIVVPMPKRNARKRSTDDV